MRTINTDRKLKRKMRVSMNIRGTEERPRIAVHRSSKYIYAQAIDDVKRVTLCSFSSSQLKAVKKMNKSEQAKQIGIQFAAILKEKNIKQAVFDRGMFTYLGRVKALAEGLRDGGLKI